MAKYCCSNFKKISGHFRWMRTNDSIYLAPHFPVADVKYRINFCPSCGKDIRSIELTREEFKKLME